MIIINDFNKFSTYKLLGCGYNGAVYENEKDAVKVFGKFDRVKIWKMIQKQSKLEILKELQLEEYVKVKELYGYLHNEQETLWAYRMDLLENNVLKRLNLSKTSLDIKNEILLKVYDILQVSHKYGIYNYDLSLENFHLSAEGKLTGMDIDNLRVKEFDVEEILGWIDDFSTEIVGEDNYLKIENYAFLRMCISFWCKEYYKLMSYDNLGKLVYTLAIDKHLKEMIYSVLEGKENIDFKDLINAVSSDKPFLRKKLFYKF